MNAPQNARLGAQTTAASSLGDMSHKPETAPQNSGDGPETLGGESGLGFTSSPGLEQTQGSACNVLAG